MRLMHRLMCRRSLSRAREGSRCCTAGGGATHKQCANWNACCRRRRNCSGSSASSSPTSDCRGRGGPGLPGGRVTYMGRRQRDAGLRDGDRKGRLNPLARPRRGGSEGGRASWAQNRLCEGWRLPHRPQPTTQHWPASFPTPHRQKLAAMACLKVLQQEGAALSIGAPCGKSHGGGSCHRCAAADGCWPHPPPLPALLLLVWNHIKKMSARCAACRPARASKPKRDCHALPAHLLNYIEPGATD